MPPRPTYEELLQAKALWDLKTVNLQTNEKGCWLWNGAKSKDGHCEFTFTTPNGRRLQTAHRAAYMYAYGEPPADDPIVRHRCDTPAFINPEHLECGTHRKNVQDRVERGRSAIGTNNGRAKLTEPDVLSIIERFETNTATSVNQIARQYGVDPKSIRQIRDGKTWVYLRKETPCPNQP